MTYNKPTPKNTYPENDKKSTGTRLADKHVDTRPKVRIFS